MRLSTLLTIPFAVVAFARSSIAATTPVSDDDLCGFDHNDHITAECINIVKLMAQTHNSNTDHMFDEAVRRCPEATRSLLPGLFFLRPSFKYILELDKQGMPAEQIASKFNSLEEPGSFCPFIPYLAEEPSANVYLDMEELKKSCVM